VSSVNSLTESPPRDNAHAARIALSLPLPRDPKYRSLDMWRGFACLMVLVYHCPIRGGVEGEAPAGPSGWLIAIAKRLWIGVPIFFVISGYCISATADSTRRRDTPLRSYFVRRVRRIFPPYWIAVAIAAVVVALVDYLLLPGAMAEAGSRGLFRPWWYSASQWFGNITLTEQWRYHIFGSGTGWFLGQAWTLCYEEQFYFVTGLLLLMAPRKFFLGAAAVSIGVGIVMLLDSIFGLPIQGFFFDGLWLQFGLGILVYYQLNYGNRTTLAVLAFGLFALTLWLARDPSQLLSEQKNATQSYFVAACFALLILLLRPVDKRMESTLWLRPIWFCGTICYSLYLVHEPLIHIVHGILKHIGIFSDSSSPWIVLLFYGSISILAGWGFYLAVERRFLNKPQSLAKQSDVPASTFPIGGMNGPAVELASV
jgi:peptidoglycan/LPS O-acetylase OafA/YrhL